MADGFCAVAEELAAAEGFPTAEQATSYASLSPAAIRGDAEIGDGIYVEHEGDDAALFVAMAAADTVEDATRRVNAFEPAIEDATARDPELWLSVGALPHGLARIASADGDASHVVDRA